jgi:tRNA dimethylallyltransferase
LKTCIIIAGPTAIGKTAIAIKVAQHFSTEIISADSRQCFKELNIGVAKPSDDELAQVSHYFINSHSIQQNLSAADFEKYALNAAEQIFVKNDIAVVVGGTGLYIKAFMQGMDEVPVIDEKIKQSIIDNYKKNGIAWLQNEIKNTDSLFYDKGEIQNPHRMIRALEIKLSTGKSILEYQSKQKKQRPFNIIPICLQAPRDVLYQQINTRVDEMIKLGLVAEVQNLIPYQHLNALQTVGYRELFDYFSGEDKSLQNAIDLIKQNTRHYAKRQITWFKKEAGIHFCNPAINDVLATIKNNLQVN